MQIPVTAEQLAASDHGWLSGRRSTTFTNAATATSATDEPVEIVNVRLTAKGRRKKPVFPPLAASEGEALVGHRDVFLDDADKPSRCAIYDRDRLSPGQKVVGPRHHRGVRLHDGAL